MAQSECGIQQKLFSLIHSALNLYPFLKTCHPLLHSCTGASFNNRPLYLCLMFLPNASMLHTPLMIPTMYRHIAEHCIWTNYLSW